LHWPSSGRCFSSPPWPIFARASARWLNELTGAIVMISKPLGPSSFRGEPDSDNPSS
jgi:hypothetical protein